MSEVHCVKAELILKDDDYIVVIFMHSGEQREDQSAKEVITK